VARTKCEMLILSKEDLAKIFSKNALAARRIVDTVLAEERRKEHLKSLSMRLMINLCPKGHPLRATLVVQRAWARYCRRWLCNVPSFVQRSEEERPSETLKKMKTEDKLLEKSERIVERLKRRGVPKTVDLRRLSPSPHAHSDVGGEGSGHSGTYYANQGVSPAQDVAYGTRMPSQFIDALGRVEQRVIDQVKGEFDKIRREFNLRPRSPSPMPAWSSPHVSPTPMVSLPSSAESKQIGATIDGANAA
jgi:hypothetical protein